MGLSAALVAWLGDRVAMIAGRAILRPSLRRGCPTGRHGSGDSNTEGRSRSGKGTGMTDDLVFTHLNDMQVHGVSCVMCRERFSADNSPLSESVGWSESGTRVFACSGSFPAPSSPGGTTPPLDQRRCGPDSPRHPRRGSDQPPPELPLPSSPGPDARCATPTPGQRCVNRSVGMDRNGSFVTRPLGILADPSLRRSLVGHNSGRKQGVATAR